MRGRRTSRATGSNGGVIDRRPDEEFREYIKRLEAERLRVIAEHREKTADAAEEVAATRDDPELEAEASAQRAAANEFLEAARRIERGGR